MQSDPKCQGIHGDACGRVGTEGMAIRVLPVGLEGAQVKQVLVIYCKECGRIHGVVPDSGKLVE
jgi:hypothetical protein